MTEEEFDKKLKWTKIFCIIISALFVIGIFTNIGKNNVSCLISIVCIGVLYLFYSFTKNKKMAGPIIGICFSVMYILSLNIFTVIVGFFILIDCVSIIKYFKEIEKQNNQNNQKNPEKQEKN